MEIAFSVNDIPIRLTDERWEHIISNKPYLLDYESVVLRAVEEPVVILRGYAGALVAVLPLGRDRFLHVVYKEVNRDDGFIVTAFIAREYRRSQVLWPSKY